MDEEVVLETGGRRQARLAYLLLYYNLGGEMLYILNQRLVAQNICPAKAVQVLNDITASLVSSRDSCLTDFLSSSAVPCARLSQSTIKATFETLISSSPLMRLSPSSYEKLFELMVGVFKYQVSLAPFPASLHLITWNHFKVLLSLSEAMAEVTGAALREAADDYMSTFEGLTRSEWQGLRSLLLSGFFADIRTRVSLLLREGCQDMDSGLFILPPTDGDDFGTGETFLSRVTHYDDDGAVSSESGHCDTIEEGTNLGEDIYATENDEEHLAGQNSTKTGPMTSDLTQNETKLLATLLGRSESLAKEFAIEFDFLEAEDEGEGKKVDTASALPALIAGKQVESKLVQPEQFQESEKEGEDETGDDLLELMDN